MNIEQAKAISIYDFLDEAGYKPAKVNGHDAWYLAPWRDERTASLHIHTGKNVWYDHGEGIGGTIIDLAISFLKAQGNGYSVLDALRLLESTSQVLPLRIAPVDTIKEVEPKLQLTKIGNIQHRALLNYLCSRGIPLNVAKLNMKEAKVYNRNTKKHFFALAMKNEDGGYELRNELFKGCIGPKDVTLIRGSDPSNKNLHVFEGAFDYETLLCMNKEMPLQSDSYILHSVSNLSKIKPLIKNCGYRGAFTWMDNDKAGKIATQRLAELFKTEDQLIHKPMNKVYHAHKDLSAWFMNRLGLSL